MSCETNQKKANAAGALAGLSGLQQKIGYVTGAVSRAVTRNIGRTAAKTLAVAESFDGPKSLDSLSMAVMGLEAGAWLWRRKSAAAGGSETAETDDIPEWLTRGIEKRRKDKAIRGGQRFFSRAQQAEASARRLRSQALLAAGVLKLGSTAGIFAGTGAARLTRDKDSAYEQRFFFPNTSKIPVGVWRSQLTPLLNRIDAGPGRLQQSDGTMLELKGKTWHRGTLVVKTAQGERTITHIQSIAQPQQHYYFNRRLSDNEAVGIVAGQKGFDPKYMDGYVGQVSEVESLAPSWARSKKSLIRGQLLWGGGGSPQPQKPRAEESKPQRKTAKQANTGPSPVTSKNQAELLPLEKVGDRVSLEGKDYPVIVRRVVNSPATRRPVADAAYYDPGAKVWKVVTDDQVRGQLADRVRAGTLQLWPVDQDQQLKE